MGQTDGKGRSHNGTGIFLKRRNAVVNGPKTAHRIVQIRRSKVIELADKFLWRTRKVLDDAATNIHTIISFFL